jgi:glycosyltransferase involved in cell wall biosynthesis
MHNIISVVTPSYNQGRFIGDTIKSILSQKGEFYIDYVIVDGASTDNSKAVITGYEKQLKEHCEIQKYHGLEFYVAKKEYGLNRCKGISYRWLSEKDRGHGDALNKGFALTIGDIMCWLNSDDMYHANAFQTVAEIFTQFGHVRWITGLNSTWNQDGTQIQISYLGRHNFKNVYSFLTGDNEWIQQESTFWHRQLWDKSGAKINTDYKFMVDGELWCRFFLHENIFHVQRELAGYRRHDSNRAHKFMPQVRTEVKRAANILYSKISDDKREIAKALSENIPLIKLDHNSLNFQIIDKTNENSRWQISDVDFLVYTSKRNSLKLKILQQQLDNANSNANSAESQTTTDINSILNSYTFKTGKLILTPVKIVYHSFQLLKNKLSSIRKPGLSFKKKLSLNSLRYPLNLDWKMITTPDRYIFHSVNKFNILLRRELASVLRTEPDIPGNVSCNFLFVKSMIRRDYNEYFNGVYKQCEDTKAMVNLTWKNMEPVPALSYFIVAFKLLWYFPILLKVIDFNLKTSLYRYFKAISYIKVWKIMRRYDFRYLISFADMQGVENMLVQYFRKKGKITATLQHGLYIDYINFDNVNRVNYENLVSDYFIAWGKETKALIERYHPNVKVIICGKPLHLLKASNSKKYFSLVFDQLLFQEQNAELLLIAYEIAKLNDLQVNVRIHPWDKKEKYSFDSDRTVFDQKLEYSMFVIGHTTSMIFECMRNGIPAFKYKTKYPSNVVSDDLTFTNTEELIKRIQDIEKYNFTELGKYYLEYVGDDSLQQYANFFNSLKKQ